MKKNELLITLSVGLILGFALIGAIDLRNVQSTNKQILEPVSSGVGENSSREKPKATILPYQKIINTPPPAEKINIAPEATENSGYALLLYDDERISSFSTNFCKLASFYGLSCVRQVINNRKPLLKSMLHDTEGNPYGLIGLDAVLLYPQYNAISDRVIKILTNAVKLDGSNLYIGKLDPLMSQPKLSTLTDEAVDGIFSITDSNKDWYVSPTNPAETFELTGINIISSQMVSPNTYSIKMKTIPENIVLISAKDDSGNKYPIYIKWKSSQVEPAGSIYLDSGEDGQSLDSISMRDIYYSAASFTQIIPMMMAFRSSYGNSIWHSDQHYANLTIDESILTEPYQNVNYTFLLDVMRKHNFHTTIGLIPESWKLADPYVVSLLLLNKQYFSVAQYGNSGQGYEFYRYSLEAVSLNNSLMLSTTSLEEQDRAILEGTARLKLLENLSNLSSDRVMIFPGGISPENTIKLLQKHGFLALSSYQDTPLDTVRPNNWDYGMYPTITDYSNFPILIRRMPETNTSYQPYLLASVLDLFINKPALFSTFPYGRSMFASGMEAFDPIADQMNGLSGNLEWQSLGYIASHTHLEKENRDGSVSIRMFTPELILTNTGKELKIYHINLSLEGGAKPKVLVNGYPFLYRLQTNNLQFDFELPPTKEARITINYDSTDN